MDKLSDARQEFSYAAQRLVISCILTFLALHYFGCIIWLTVRLQHFPEGGRLHDLVIRTQGGHLPMSLLKRR